MGNLIKNYLKYRGLRILVRDGKEFKEEDHKRDEKGRFAKMNGGKTDSTVYSKASPQISKKDFINGFNSIIRNIEKDIGSNRMTQLLMLASLQFEFNFENNGYDVPQSKNELMVQLSGYIDENAESENETSKVKSFMSHFGMIDKLCQMAGIDNGAGSKNEPKEEPKEEPKIKAEPKKTNVKNNYTPVTSVVKDAGIIKALEKSGSLNQNITKTKTDGDVSIYEAENIEGDSEYLYKVLPAFNKAKEKMAKMYNMPNLKQNVLILNVNKAAFGFVSSGNNANAVSDDIVINGKYLNGNHNIENTLLHEYQHNLLKSMVANGECGSVSASAHEFASELMASVLDGESGVEVADMRESEDKFLNQTMVPYYFGLNFGRYFYEEFGHEGFMDLIKNSNDKNITDAIVDFYRRHGSKDGFQKIMMKWLTKKYPDFVADKERAVNFIRKLKKAIDVFEFSAWVGGVL